MSGRFSWNAIVVGHVDIGESSRVIRMLTSEAGRVAAVARGARSSPKRWAGAFDPGTRVRAEVKRTGEDLGVLTSAEPVSGPSRSRNDLDRLALLLYACELCSALAPEDHPAEKLYGLLSTFLDLLEGERPPGGALRVALEAKALTFAGFTPSLLKCARCGENIDDPAVFSLDEGGILHARCGGGARVAAEDSLAVEILRRTPLSEIEGPAPPGFRWLLSDFARYQLGHDLRSRALLADLDRTGGAP